MQNVKLKNKINAFTLIEVIVGIAVLLVVMAGIYGAFQMVFMTVGSSRARIDALALANQRIEEIRNLPYNKIGTISGIPTGAIPQTEEVVRNNNVFTLETSIIYIDDPFDGVAPDDTLNTDYKRVRVEVNWQGLLSSRPVILITDVAPRGIETTVGGGTLMINVFDAQGIKISQASVHIENNDLDPNILINTLTDSNGRVILPGSPESIEGYEIIITKEGYSTDRTYEIDPEDNPNPVKPNATVLEGELTKISFAIDKTSTKVINTLEPKIQFKEGTTDGDLADFPGLLGDPAQSFTTRNNGFKVSRIELFIKKSADDPSDIFLEIRESSTIGPVIGTSQAIDSAVLSNGLEWEMFSFSEPVNLNSNTEYFLRLRSMPDSADPSSGAAGIIHWGYSQSEDSPYPDGKAYRYVGRDNNPDDPGEELSQYDFSFSIPDAPSVANLPFHIRGGKTIGTDSDGNPIYKFSQDLTTGADGQIEITDLEWDSYIVTVDGAASGYNIASSMPPQPVNILPDTANSTTLTLVPHAENTLLVTVKDAGGASLAGVLARLYNVGLSYDEILTTGQSGQVFFTPLNKTTYSLELAKSGYEDYSTEVEISGQTNTEVVMNAQ